MNKLLAIVFIYLYSFSCFATSYYTVPDSFTNTNSSYWNALITAIKTDKDNNIVLLWQGIGGSVEEAENTYYRISRIHKNIVIKIIGPSISAHALVACYLPELIDFKSGYFVFHNAFIGYFHNKKIFANSETAELMNQCIRAGYVTQKDKDLIINNKMRMELFPNGKKVFLGDWK